MMWFIIMSEGTFGRNTRQIGMTSIHYRVLSGRILYYISLFGCCSFEVTHTQYDCVVVLIECEVSSNEMDRGGSNCYGYLRVVFEYHQDICASGSHLTW